MVFELGKEVLDALRQKIFQASTTLVQYTEMSLFHGTLGLDHASTWVLNGSTIFEPAIASTREHHFDRSIILWTQVNETRWLTEPRINGLHCEELESKRVEITYLNTYYYSFWSLLLHY